MDTPHVTDHLMVTLREGDDRCALKGCGKPRSLHGVMHPITRDVHANDLIPAVQAWDAYSEHVRKLIVRKSAGYRNAWERQGYMGNLGRVLSKSARLENMMWRDPGDEEFGTGTALDESVLDTLWDLGALCAFTVANIEEGNRWGPR